MAEFAYNNTKNTSPSYTIFKLDYGYHLCIFYEKNFDSFSKLKTVEKLSFELQNLIVIC